MKYCGLIGQSIETVVEGENPSCPAGWIEMESERPAPEYIADASGNWVLPTTTEEELADHACKKRDQLMEIAFRKIRLIEVDIKLANYNPDNDDTPEKRNLTAWEIYLSKLDKIEQQANFPYQIDWPDQPD